jgi:hypothetical protein
MSIYFLAPQLHIPFVIAILSAVHNMSSPELFKEMLLCNYISAMAMLSFQQSIT